MTQTPSRLHGQHFQSAEIPDPATVARLTGLPLRDTSRIALLSKGIKVAPDGTVIAGQHRLLALIQLAAK